MCCTTGFLSIILQQENKQLTSPRLSDVSALQNNILYVSLLSSRPKASPLICPMCVRDKTDTDISEATQVVLGGPALSPELQCNITASAQLAAGHCQTQEDRTLPSPFPSSLFLAYSHLLTLQAHSASRPVEQTLLYPKDFKNVWMSSN